MFNKDVMNFVGFVAGLCAAGYAYYISKKMDAVAKRLDTTVDKISENVDVDVSEAMINEAVEKAVNREAKKTVKEAADSVKEEIRKDIYTEVKKSVDLAYRDTKESVKMELEKQIGELNIDGVRREVIEKAKNTAAAKFNDDLALVLEKYNSNLANVHTIYKSIAGAFNPKTELPF